MFVAKTIASEHKDLIHDVSFDYHGKRMATCSSDQTVKVSSHRLVGSIGSNFFVHDIYRRDRNLLSSCIS